jgi:asparaginyl-tRNA synthetase
MVRKPESVERNEWVELSASATKKLIKLISVWRKKEEKLAKEGERLDKEKKEAEERDRQRREEAKNIVLVDDSSKGEAKKVNLFQASFWLTRC